jgi:hypothetical protein
MDYSSQLSEFALYFYQDFGDSPGDTIENNIYSFFSSPRYTDGKALASQVAEFEKIVFSPSGRGSSWRNLGGSMWVEGLEDRRVWEALKILAQECPSHESVLSQVQKFENCLHELLILAK